MEDKQTPTKMDPLPPNPPIPQNRATFFPSNAPPYNLLDHPEFYMLGKQFFSFL